MMDKQGVVRPGLTPPVQDPDDAKNVKQAATKRAATEQLDDDQAKRLADAAAKALKP